MIKFRLMMTSVAGSLGPLNLEMMKASIPNKVWVLGVDARHDYNAENLADKFEIVPKGDDPGYLERVCYLIKKFQINLVIPCSDEEAVTLSTNRNKVEKLGAKVACAPKKSIQIMSNKLLTYNFLENKNVSVPKYKIATNLKELANCVGDFYNKYESFVIKDPIARGNRGTILVDRKINGKVDFMGSRETHVGWSFYNKNIRSIIDDNFPKLILERLYKPAYDIDILANKGKVINLVPRERINPAGVPYQGNIIRNDEKLIKLAKKVSESFCLTWLYDLDIMTRKDGTPVVVEVNPRPSGSSVASILSGIPLYKNLLYLFENKVSKNKYTLPAGRIVVPTLKCRVIS